jgi:hypothetical protein
MSIIVFPVSPLRVEAVFHLYYPCLPVVVPAGSCSWFEGMNTRKWEEEEKIQQR